MYKGCIFDLDGTLLNTIGTIASYGNAALEKFGLAPIEPSTYKQLVGNGASTRKTDAGAKRHQGRFSIQARL